MSPECVGGKLTCAVVFSSEFVLVQAYTGETISRLPLTTFYIVASNTGPLTTITGTLQYI